MNNDVEKLLSDLSPARPSDQLDKRITQLMVSASATARTPVLRRPVPLWLCAATCALCVVLGFLSRMSLSERRAPVQEPTQVIHFIHSDRGATRPVFDWTPSYDPFWDGAATQTTITVSTENGRNPNSDGKI